MMKSQICLKLTLYPLFLSCSVVSVLSTKSSVSIKGMNIKEEIQQKPDFWDRCLCFNVTSSKAKERSEIQRHYFNERSFSIYVNCYCHRLVFSSLFSLFLCLEFRTNLVIDSALFNSALKLKVTRFQGWAQQ